MQVALVENSGSKEALQLSETVFACRFNEPLVHQVVTAYLAAGRQGTHAQKNRSAVRGGGKKPHKQKGTGRARAGTIRSPLWRGGGVTFAASPRDYSQKVNKKMYRLAMRSICSELLRQDRFLVTDSFLFEQAKTRHLVARLKEYSAGPRVLIVLDEISEAVFLAARNIPNVDVSDVEAINPVDLINHEKIIITVSALKQIEELLT
jgi:large subunit ribosomal protein L4